MRGQPYTLCCTAEYSPPVLPFERPYVPIRFGRCQAWYSVSRSCILRLACASSQTNSAAILHGSMLLIHGAPLSVPLEIECLDKHRCSTMVTSRCLGGTMSVGCAQRGGTVLRSISAGRKTRQLQDRLSTGPVQSIR